MDVTTCEIVQIPVAGSDNFSYLVICTETGKAFGIDPGVSPESLLQVVRERGLDLEVLGNTHGHSDHVAGNAEVIRATGAKLAASPIDVPDPDIPLVEGSQIRVGNLTIDVLHTPGHSPGAVVFNPPGALITGDTLFVTRCGRADFRNSDPAALYHSLLRLAAYPPETRVFPGHDYGPKPNSTIAYERQHNDYIRCPDLESFIKLRMG
jgi:glyoxylase-like metal-dependent hydrolase (beta-lactamase superfamily II)